MPVPRFNPFRAEHCDCLDRVIESTAGQQELLDCLKQCGLPMDELEARNRANRELAVRLKQNFFPDRA
jgi:hypothetical protein